MEPVLVTGAVAADACAVAELIAAVESSLYGRSAFSQADLAEEWSSLDLEQNARVVRAGDRIVGYGAVHERGERWNVEGYVHPAALGRGIGKLIATELEQHAARQGAGKIHSSVLEPDLAGRKLLESLGYGAVRVFRELRVELDAPPAAPEWPGGLHIVAFDPERDGRGFHAAQEEAFADHWEYTPREFESWSYKHLASARFDSTLWCVVRAGDEIAAGSICTADTYGGGWVQVLFTRRPWRRKGVATALLNESFRRFWGRGEHSIGLGVDTANPIGAFGLYESAGMAATLGLVVYEKQLGDSE
jgi:GNAT superfamily N-acetyltransferase